MVDRVLLRPFNSWGTIHSCLPRGSVSALQHTHTHTHVHTHTSTERADDDLFHFISSINYSISISVGHPQRVQRPQDGAFFGSSRRNERLFSSLGVRADFVPSLNDNTNGKGPLPEGQVQGWSKTWWSVSIITTENGCSHSRGNSCKIQLWGLFVLAKINKEKKKTVSEMILVQARSESSFCRFLPLGVNTIKADLCSLIFIILSLRPEKLSYCISDISDCAGRFGIL